MALHPLLRPRAFFEERVPLRLGPAVAVVLLVALATTAGVGLLGVFVAGSTHGTVTVDNPDRPPEAFCDGPLNDTDSSIRDGCQLSETREVPASELFWRAFREQLPLAFVAPIVFWPLVAGALHLASRPFDASGGFSQSLAVAAWGMLPSALRILLAVAGAAVVLHDTMLSADPEVLSRQVKSLRDLSSGPMILVAAGEAAWQGYIWAWGLAEARDIDLSSAALAAGVVAFAGFLIDVAG